MEWVPFYQTEIFTIKQQIKTFHFKIKSGMCDGVLIVTKEKSHNRGRRDHCRMVVGFTTTCAICLSPLKLWVWTPLRRGVLDKTLCDEVYQWLARCRWFSPVSSINTTNHNDLTEILLIVALNTIHQLTNLNQRQTHSNKPCTY